MSSVAVAGAYGALDDNCGVDFDGKCDDVEGTKPANGTDPGECAEGDEDCLERKRQSVGSADAGGKSRQGSLNVDGGTDAPLQTSLPVDAKVELSKPPVFEGLPREYYKKHYRPDYPNDLQMRTVCASPTKSRKAGGALKSHPKVVFVPSDPSLATLQKRAAAAAGQSAVVKPMNLLAEPSPLQQNRMPPPILSGSDELVVDWLEDHNIQMMLEYFLGLCVIHQPEDPWSFISELCGKMIDARRDIGAFDDLPRILSPEHTEAIFRIYDRIGNGFITTAQYKSAMEAMGLNRFSTNPNGWGENMITKDTFVKEATEAINNLLRSFMAFDGDDIPSPETGGNMNNGKRSMPGTEMRKSEGEPIPLTD